MTNPVMLFGLDPTGQQAMILCALATLALIGLIVGGFALLWRAERVGHRSVGSARYAPRELGLLGLWRLDRTLRHGSRSCLLEAKPE